jgi:hypothetical protein
VVHWSAGISRRNLDWRAQRTQRQSLTTAEADRKPSTSVMYLTSATSHAENDESATSHAERGGWERDDGDTEKRRTLSRSKASHAAWG